MCRCGPDSPGLRTFVDEPRGGETTPDRGTTPVGQVQVLPSQRSIRRKRIGWSSLSSVSWQPFGSILDQSPRQCCFAHSSGRQPSLYRSHRKDRGPCRRRKRTCEPIEWQARAGTAQDGSAGKRDGVRGKRDGVRYIFVRKSVFIPCESVSQKQFAVGSSRPGSESGVTRFSVENLGKAGDCRFPPPRE